MTTPAPLLCPSAHPDMEGARVFAIAAGTASQPQASYLDRTLPLDAELRALAGPLSPAEVFRSTAPCAKAGCAHFDSGGQACSLVQRLVAHAPVAVQLLPRCAIRTRCVWWQQEGAAACRRCPQVVTQSPRG